MVRPSRSDEPGARPEPIFAIPFRRSRLILSLVPGIALVGLIVLGLMLAQRLRPDRIHLKWDPGPVGSAGWIRAYWPFAAVAAVVLAAAMVPWPPGFAVFQDGIKLPIKRSLPGSSMWDVWRQGFYSWSEVDDCRWSRYRPGELVIHLRAVASRGLFAGTRFETSIQIPPMIFHYHVPERHRPAVEAAIRACDKWAE